MIDARLTPEVDPKVSPDFWCRTYRSIFFFIVVAVAPCIAMSQFLPPSTVGEVLQMGGGPVDDQRLIQLVAGSKWRTTYGTLAELAFLPDFTFAGQGAVGGSLYSAATGVFGVWAVNEKNQLCITWKHQGGLAYAPFCRSWYLLDSRYFAGGAPDKPSAKVWLQERIE